MEEGNATDKDAENVLRIMVATDNHLGYGEKDAVRGDDSFVAFEEILQMAVDEDVDMILLGGDLFHDAVPSQNAMHKCIEMLRRYTFGDKPVSLEILSDQSTSFHNAINQSVNYEDPNLNIAIPVFSIHGNHDDPSGFGRLSSLDLLSTTGLVNYFGRWTDLTKVEISPILIRKGESKLALYGLSHIHDARLARLFKDYQVVINGPNEADEEWFHLMVIHQNRADRGPKNYIPEEALPSFLHLVIWGHEHDCRIDPELNVLRDFYVSQPGSSVATSLSEGEAKRKHVAILEIYKTKFHLTPLPLKTVRPFVFESVILSDWADRLNLGEGDASTKVYHFAKERVEAMIEKARLFLTGHAKQPTEPLIRLRLLYSEESHMFNTIRFSQMFVTRVANPADVVKFERLSKRIKSDKISVDKEAMQRAMEVDNTTRVEQLVDNYFEEAKAKNPLKLMHSKALAEITYRLVEHKDTNAADSIFKYYNQRAVDHLMEALPDDENVDEELSKFRLRYSADDILKALDACELKRNIATSATGSVPKVESNVDLSESNSRGGARGRAARGRGRSRATASTAVTTTTSRSNDTLSRSSSRQQTLLAAVNSGRSAKTISYVISDDDD